MARTLHRCPRPTRCRCAEIERHVAAVVDRAPPLTAAQRDKLAVLLAVESADPAPAVRRSA